MYAGEICAARKGVAADFRDAGRDSNTGDVEAQKGICTNCRDGDAVDFRGNDHDRVGSVIFCDRSGCQIKGKCISSCRNCNGKGGTRFGIPIPVGQIKADNKVMLGFFSIRAGVDLYVITTVNCIIQFSAGSSDRRTPLIGIAVVLYK